MIMNGEQTKICARIEIFSATKIHIVFVSLSSGWRWRQHGPPESS